MVRFVIPLLLATSASTANAFAGITPTQGRAPFFVKIVDNEPVAQKPSPPKAVPSMDNLAAMEETPKMAAATAPKKAVKKAGGAQHKGGLLTPIVKLAKTVAGEDNINQVRGKVIGLHSKVIGSFVETYDTPVGRFALKALFESADADKSGTIDKEELGRALRKLGFELNDKQIGGIFDRADQNKDGSICWEEFQKEAPKTLRTNLTKLAKKNGNEMGLLS